MKRLYTSNYARNSTHPKAIAISAYTPKWGYEGAWLPILAPSKKLLHDILDEKITQEQYDERYMDEIINERKLTPKKVVDMLPEGSIMLCYEKPTDHCHRHLLREWLNNSGEAIVEELLTAKEIRKQELDIIPMDDLFIE